MNIYTDVEQWRIDLITNPPRVSKMFSTEEWTHIVMNELLNMKELTGENNPNKDGHRHTDETKAKISKNHSRHWKGKEVPWKGCSRPDAVEIARKMALGNIGRAPWNKGKAGLQICSDDTKKKIGDANRNPKRKIACPHCSKVGGEPQMKQWHFDNCKEIK